MFSIQSFCPRRCHVIALATIAATGYASAQSPELHPGELVGTVLISGETVMSGRVDAYATTGGFSSSQNFSGSTFSLTVEGGHDYRTTIDARISNSSGSYTSLRVHRSSPTVWVPVGGNGGVDFNYQSARIEGGITVVGGSLNSFQIYAYSNGPDGYEQARHNGSSAAFSFPMVQSESVSLYGTAYITTDGGVYLSRPLSTQSVSHLSSGTSVSWALDVTDVDTDSGEIAGIVSVSPSSAVSGTRIYASGTPSRSTSVAGNGPYAMSNLTPGRFWVYATTYFQPPYSFLQLPDGEYVDVIAGATTTKDFVVDLGFAHGTLNLEGFFDSSEIDYGYVYSNQLIGNGYGYDRIGAGGEINLALSSGDWYSGRYFFVLRDYADPAQPLDIRITAYDYSLHHPYYGGTPVAISAGVDTLLPAPTLRISEGEIIFDVVENPSQPDVLISSPRIHGYAQRYDDNDSTVGSKDFWAYGPSQPDAQPSVRIAAEPGTYSVTAYATINGASVRFASFNWTLEDITDTPVGTNVDISLSPTVSLEFDNVTSPGLTTMSESPIGPESPEGFRVGVPGGDPIYYDITSNVTFSGTVDICIQYDDTGLGNKEKNLRLYHYLDPPGHWGNITKEGSPDQINNEICGTTDSFSIFAILEMLDGDEDGIGDLSDNCPDTANANQLDSDADGIGDVCDNCPATANSDQADADGDGIGNVCENRPPIAHNLGVVSDEDTVGAAYLTGVDPDGDPITFAVTAFPAHCVLEGSAPNLTYTAPADWNGTDSFTFAVSDGSMTSAEATVSITVNPVNDPPNVEAISGAPAGPIPVETEISVTASFNDVDRSDTHTSIWNWGDGSSSAGSVDEATGSGTVSGSHTYTTPGIYAISIAVADDGLSDSSTHEYVVVYDPDGGFLTGGGWIQSPAGAYAPDPTIEGRANFGFVAKYKKGQSVPDGQTQFRFMAADLKFHSTAYQWLVIAGKRAQFKGEGEINGEPGFGFMLSAIDGYLNGGDGIDRFRVKIWAVADETVVYDNQMGGEDDAEPETDLGGGSIVIHSGKGR